MVTMLPLGESDSIDVDRGIGMVEIRQKPDHPYVS